LKNKPSPIRRSREDKIFILIDQLLVLFVFIVVFYPLWYILIMSFDGDIYNLSLRLLPSKWSLNGYRAVFNYSRVWTGYRNSLIYMVLGTAVNMVVTICAAYPLSRKDLRFRRPISLLFVFTMYFSGGMIPGYLLVSSLGMIDTIWAMLIPGAMSVYNMIVMRTYFETAIPGELREAASIDGCNNVIYLFKIVLPLSMPILAVIGMFYMVGHWNSYFNALLYLNDNDRFPLQMIIREILVINSVDSSSMADFDPESAAAMMERMEIMRYSLVVVASAPMLILFPFVQKYFVKGLMIGAVKG